MPLQIYKFAKRKNAVALYRGNMQGQESNIDLNHTRSNALNAVSSYKTG
jgi:hypothetical protein